LEANLSGAHLVMVSAACPLLRGQRRRGAVRTPKSCGERRPPRILAPPCIRYHPGHNGPHSRVHGV